MGKKKKIIFMLQNGIGFGHFKLALTISRYLKDECEISFITQSKSTLIFDNYNYKVYNFPMLYTLKSNNEILILNKLLNSLIENIQPDLIIEDTYPEDFYLNLPALKNVSKILIMNRLTASEFENFYYNGVINQYDKLIVLKDKTCFMNDITSKEVKNYMNFSNKVTYLSGVFNEPTEAIRKEISKKYKLDQFEKNIVISCGAGGWHIGENVCEKIFEESIKAVKKIVRDGKNVQAILVLGPYSNYLKKKFERYLDGNITIVDFETNLDALFHVADLTILRPGYNSTMEAISGNSNILLLPGISYMEDQNIWCEELAKEFGVDYLNVNELDNIYNKIISLLDKNIRTKVKPVNNTNKVANEILKFINSECKNTSINLLINNLSNSTFSINDKELNNSVFLTKDGKNVYAKNIPILNMSDIQPKAFGDYDSFIIYNDVNLELNNASYYESRYHMKNAGYIILEYQEIIYKNTKQMLKELTSIIKNSEKFNNNIVIKIPKMSKKRIYDEFMKPLSDFIIKNNIHINRFESILNDYVNNKISNYQYGYYRPEITKLN